MKDNIFFFVFILFLIGCTSTSKLSPENEMLFRVENDTVTVDEFLYVFSKNNLGNDSVISRESIVEYFDLFVNFKLKVSEAKKLGLDQEASFKTELEGYRQQLAKPYLTATKVTDQLIEEAYNRSLYEINASHILLGIPPDASPEDSLKVFNRILEIKEKYNAGEPFENLAREFSEDPSAARNAGNLGYFSAMQMVYPFESMAYNTPVGEVSEPIRTRFGYHLIHVLDKRRSQGKVKVAHIMIRSNANQPENVKIENKNKIDEIHKRLSQGEDWALLCSQFSQDMGTSRKGGELPWIGTGSVDPTFEQQAFNLADSGDISQPFSTPYGWHIVKLIDKKEVETYEEMEDQLRQRVEKDSRAELSRSVWISRLKSEYNFKHDSLAYHTLLEASDSTLLEGKWEPDKQLLDTENILFTVANQPVKYDSFFVYLKGAQKRVLGRTPKFLMNRYLDEFEETVLTQYEESQLSTKYKDYRMVLKEYYEGILLFELMDEKVWSKAVEDTLGLRQFFNQNIEDYQWEERLSATIIDAADDQIIDEIQNRKVNDAFIIDELIVPALKDSIFYSSLDQMLKDVKDNESYSILYSINSDNQTSVKSIVNYMLENEVKNENVRVTSEFFNGSERILMISSSAKALERLYNQDDALAMQVIEGLFEKHDHPVLSQFEWSDDEQEKVLTFDNRHFYIWQNEILGREPKNLENIKGNVISDYQTLLEKEWLEELKKKYSVEINESAFERSIEILQNK